MRKQIWNEKKTDEISERHNFMNRMFNTFDLQTFTVDLKTPL